MITHKRTHYSSDLSSKMIGSKVTLGGWIANIRDHGSMAFFDLRDYRGVVQCLIHSSHADFEEYVSAGLESVVLLHGEVNARPSGTENQELCSGSIEIAIESIEFLSKVKKALPFKINSEDSDTGEDIRLRYRFLDLRRPSGASRLRLRSEIIKTIRLYMEENDFIEIHTPFLTSSSPEGARDYVVPSRLHSGKFYALPQAPQQFKQLLMVAGVERYYQIAPCFRDEDPRADRAAGAFYQLDMEMAFADREDVFRVIENLMYNLFSKFCISSISKPKFIRIPYKTAVETYGSDKPDLRNPLKIVNVTQLFKQHIADDNPTEKFVNIFGPMLEKNAKICLIPAPKLSMESRGFFDEIREFAIKSSEKVGTPIKDVGYIIFDKNTGAKGSLAKVFNEDMLTTIQQIIGAENDGAFLIAHQNHRAFDRLLSIMRNKIADELDIIEKNAFRFCWITDFPMYEVSDDGSWDFAHNPFSMPKGELSIENIENIIGEQYDLVCNGCEICSGAVRNYDPEVMYKMFEIIGLSKEYVYQNFQCMIEAFEYGAPPHAGCAPGIERLIMLISGAQNVREVIPFPLTQNGLDLMTGAPSAISEDHLNKLGLKITKAIKDVNKSDTKHG